MHDEVTWLINEGFCNKIYYLWKRNSEKRITTLFIFLPSRSKKYSCRKGGGRISKTRNVCIDVALRLVHAKLCCSWKKIIMTYSECMFVTLFTQHAVHMRRIVLLSVICLSVSNIFFHVILQTARFWKKKKLLNIKFEFCLSSQILSESLFILRRIHRVVVIHGHKSSCKMPVIIFRF